MHSRKTLIHSSFYWVFTYVVVCYRQTVREPPLSVDTTGRPTGVSVRPWPPASPSTTPDHAGSSAYSQVKPPLCCKQSTLNFPLKELKADVITEIDVMYFSDIQILFAFIFSL